jgi:WD repeat-containing protein 19
MGEMFEKAVAIYIQTKTFDNAEPLLSTITTPKLHMQYAKAMEASGKFDKALSAYEFAKDFDSVIRICLEHLNIPQKAFTLVRESKSSEGARLAAKYCQEHGDIKGAIEFLFMSNCSDEAFELSKTHSEMEAFANMLMEDGTTQQYLQIASYYESKSDWSNAGNFYALCNNYNKALKFYLQNGEKDISKAIELVGKAKSEVLTHTLVDYLTGETDGITKDPNYIFHLYMALGNFSQAARTAIIIARQEQEVGNYKVAHDILFQTSKDLDNVNIKVPLTLSRSLLLLHRFMVFLFFY